MSEPIQKPVIFLAFAQDRVEGGAYLRNLPSELDGIRPELWDKSPAGRSLRSDGTPQHHCEKYYSLSEGALLDFYSCCNKKPPTEIRRKHRESPNYFFDDSR